jgi:YfiH family protein
MTVLPAMSVRAVRDGRRAVVAVTDRGHGDLQVDQPEDVLNRRRQGVTAQPWTWLEQVHGAEVVTVEFPADGAGRRADASVTSAANAPLAVHTADCAPVALIGADGVVGVVHAGWRGLQAGVIEATVRRMDAMDAGELTALVGPCIHPECYEFGASELESLASQWGHQVRGVTQGGTPAFDLPAAVQLVLEAAGVADIVIDERCTGCDPNRYSHRTAGDLGRQAVVVWIES